MPKKTGNGLGQCSDLRSGTWKERGDGIFGGWVDNPMHTVICKFQKGMSSNVTRLGPERYFREPV